MSIILNVINYFWKLGFNEEAPDVYAKAYGGQHRFLLNLAEEAFDFGNEVEVVDKSLTLFSQKNFVVMESLDRLLTRGLPPNALRLGGTPGYDYIARVGPDGACVSVRCAIWEDEFDAVVMSQRAIETEPSQILGGDETIEWFIVYTSRL